MAPLALREVVALRSFAKILVSQATAQGGLPVPGLEKSVVSRPQGTILNLPVALMRLETNAFPVERSAENFPDFSILTTLSVVFVP